MQAYMGSRRNPWHQKLNARVAPTNPIVKLGLIYALDQSSKVVFILIRTTNLNSTVNYYSS